MRRLFIDPGSRSLGWAEYEDKKLKAHGTVSSPKGKVPIEKRLSHISKELFTLFEHEMYDEIYVERLNRRTHHFALWSVGTILGVLGGQTFTFHEHPSPNQWKKVIGLKQKDKGAPVRAVFENIFPTQLFSRMMKLRRF